MSLHLQCVSVRIGRAEVVREVSLDVPTGTMAGLIGPNGSGKSTLLRAIYRSRRPSAGRILLDGADVYTLHPRELARRVAVATQHSTVEFDLTVRELVLTGRTPHKAAYSRDTDEDLALIDEALDRVGCAHLSHRSIRTLSGGERQRVLIARALAQQADHLLLDEPTNHLDLRYQVEILELVRGLAISVLAALHDLNLAAAYCDTLHVLTDGMLLQSGPPAEVLTADLVQRAYGVDVHVLAHPDSGLPHVVPRGRSPRVALREQIGGHR